MTESSQKGSLAAVPKRVRMSDSRKIRARAVVIIPAKGGLGWGDKHVSEGKASRRPRWTCGLRKGSQGCYPQAMSGHLIQ